MREARCELWDMYNDGEWIAITTNGFVKKNGECVMGKGCAREARDRFPTIASALGTIITSGGNHVAKIAERIVSFPVKHNWWEDADIDLIKQSCDELTAYLTTNDVRRIYLPRPGCGNGKLKWNTIGCIIDPLLDDRVIVVTR